MLEEIRDKPGERHPEQADLPQRREYDEIFDNAQMGVSIRTDSNSTLRRNRIYNNKRGGVIIQQESGGTLENNDLRGNPWSYGNLNISKDSKPNVKLVSNQK